MNNFGQQYIPNPASYMPQDSTMMYQQRLNNMAQQVMNQAQPNTNYGFGFQPMQNPVNQMQGQNFNVRVVSGQEEAMASQTPLDGSILILIDRFHNTMYTKQLNMNDGTPLVKRYKQIEAPQSVEPDSGSPVEYVKKSEFDELKARFDEVWTALTEKSNETKPTTSKKEANK